MLYQPEQHRIRRIKKGIQRLTHQQPRYKQAVLAVFPALLLSPLLFGLFPYRYYTGRSLGGFFHTLGWVELGARSIFVETAIESFSNPFHLHSLLSAPLLAAGWNNAGRFVTLLSAVAAAYCIGRIAHSFYGESAGYLAIAAFWAQPYVIRTSYLWRPEMLSIAITTAAILFLYKYYHNESDHYFWISVSLVALAPTVHFWEAIVGLPVFVLALHHRDYRGAAILAIVDWLAAGIIQFVGQFQTARQSSFFDWWGIHKTSFSIFLDHNWWLSVPPWETPSSVVNPLLWISNSIILPLSIAGFIICAIWWYMKRTEAAALLAAWFASGLSIIFLIPGGYSNHMYLVWGLIAPLSVSLGILLNSSTKLFTGVERKRLQTAILTLLILSTVSYAVPIELGAGTSEEYVLAASEEEKTQELRAAGLELKEMGISEPKKIAFLGSWYQPANRYISDIGIILAYADILPERWGEPTNTPDSETVGNISDETEVCVDGRGDSIEVYNCSN